MASLDSIHVYFDVDEATFLRIRRGINVGKAAAKDIAGVSIQMALPGEEGFSHRSAVDFLDNQANTNRAAALVRGVFANPRPKDGVHLLTPRMTVRVRLPIGNLHDALLVNAKAAGGEVRLRR